MKVLLTSLAAIVISASLFSCAAIYPMYHENVEMSRKKMKSLTESANVDSVYGCECSIINATRSHLWNRENFTHIVIRAISPGLTDGWDGYLPPGGKISKKLLPGTYVMEVYKKNGEKDLDWVGEEKEVLASGRVYDGTQEKCQVFRYPG